MRPRRRMQRALAPHHPLERKHCPAAWRAKWALRAGGRSTKMARATVSSEV